jgi:hypothetical protein
VKTTDVKEVLGKPSKVILSMTITPPLRRLRQEDVSLRPTWLHSKTLSQKTKSNAGDFYYHIMKSKVSNK